MPWLFTRKNSRAKEPPAHPKRPRNYGISPWLGTAFAPPPQPPLPTTPPPKAPQRSTQHRKREPYPNDVDFTDLKAVSRDYEHPTYLPPQPWMPPPPPNHYPNPYNPPPNPLFSDPRFFPQNWAAYYQHQYPHPGHTLGVGPGVAPPQQPHNQFSQSHHTKPRRHTTSNAGPSAPAPGNHTLHSVQNHSSQNVPPVPRGHTRANTHPAAQLPGSSTPYRNNTSIPTVDESPRTQITLRNTLQNKRTSNAEHAPHPQYSGNPSTLTRAASRSGVNRGPAPAERPTIPSPLPTFLSDIVTLPSGECMIQYNIAFSPDTALRLTGDPNIIADDIAATTHTEMSLIRHGPMMREGALLLPSEKVVWNRRIVDPPVKRVALKVITRQDLDIYAPVVNHYGHINVSAKDGQAVTIGDVFRAMREFFNIPIDQKAYAAVPEVFKQKTEANLMYRRNSRRFWPTPDDAWRVKDDDCREGGPRIMDFFGYYHKFGGLSPGEEPFGGSKKPVFLLTLTQWDYGQWDEDSDFSS